MSIRLLVMTDGRDDYLARTLASINEMVTGPITRRTIHDDSGDPDHVAWLLRTYPGYTVVAPASRAGFGGAIRSAWASMLCACVTEQFVFATEDDFVFNRPVNLDAMVDVLTVNLHLVQLALRRQAWNAAERAAGGVIEQQPDAYEEVTAHNGTRWLTHRQFFTTNPSLYRRTLCGMAWPDGDQSEGRFTAQLLTDGSPEVSGAAVRFGYWGARTDPPWVEHIGVERAGNGY